MEYNYKTDNLLANRYRERYNSLPDEIKHKIDTCEAEQLKIIKRKRIYPEIGDVFKLVTNEDITINGIVVNNHINNINGNDLLLTAILKYQYDYKKLPEEGITKKNLMLMPQILSKGYWSRGYFFNIDHIQEKIRIDKYGFYNVIDGRMRDEYGNPITEEPELLGLYGVNTIWGISQKVNDELIIAGII